MKRFVCRTGDAMVIETYNYKTKLVDKKTLRAENVNKYFHMYCIKFLNHSTVL